MTQTEQKQTIIAAINSIDDKRLLNMIARLIYGITNPMQNGSKGNQKAAEIIQSIMQ